MAGAASKGKRVVCGSGVQVMLVNKCSSAIAQIINGLCGTPSIEHYLDITTREPRSSLTAPSLSF
jgi:hypothetical protein